jgi:hypothetical membrane protein
MIGERFAKRYPAAGPIVWVLSIQYYIVQLIAARDWSVPYSLSKNTISDLGVTSCGTYPTRFPCSPLHGLMNVSFIILGAGMIGGSVLIYHQFKRGRGSAIGFSLMAAAGAGTILVGLFPENTVGGLHIFGAALPFLLGNLCLLVLGSTLQLPKTLRYYTIFSGAIALLALVHFLTNHYLGIGIGGMERLTAYPQSIWLIVFGIYSAAKKPARPATS